MYLSRDESGEVPVDPSSDDDHGQDVGEVALEHVGHHAGVGHGVGRARGGRLLLLEHARLLVVEEVAAHEERLLRQEATVLAHQTGPDQDLAKESNTIIKLIFDTITLNETLG